MEVYNNGGDGWGTIFCKYEEWSELNNATCMHAEIKRWQIFLSFHQSKILEFSFNRHFSETITYDIDYWVEY